MDEESKTIQVYVTREEPEKKSQPKQPALNYDQSFVTVDVDGQPQTITVTSPDMSAIAWQYGDDPGTTKVSSVNAPQCRFIQLTLCVDQAILCR
jgi:hypothetical protein